MSAKQQLKFTIYPTFGKPRTWQLSAYLFGDWAVHQQHPEVEGTQYWIVSHAPTGAAGFACEKFVVALQAAKRLATLESPTVKIINKGKKSARIKPLPAEWVAESIRLVADMDIWCLSNGFMVHPSDIACMLNEQELQP